ncbi:MAG: Chaperone for flagella basal body P-ring formation [Pseudomonadota bacterium]|jgi:hypothetical protein
MLAIEFPPNQPIALEYVGLSQSGAAAELQKDVLRRALSELLPASDEVLEVGAASANSPSSGIFMRCLQCDVKGDLSQFTLKVQEDDRFGAIKNLSRSQFRLHITHQNGQTQTWTVEVGARKLAWYPMLKTDSLTADGKLSKKNFVSLSCLEGVNCPQTKLYSDQNDCLSQVQKWTARRLDASALSFSSRQPLLLAAERIPFVHEVKANSFVRASVVSKSSSLSIKTSVKALKSGGLGETIPVEIQTMANTFKRGRQLEARVTAEGEVEIVR